MPRRSRSRTASPPRAGLALFVEDHRQAQRGIEQDADEGVGAEQRVLAQDLRAGRASGRQEEGVGIHEPLPSALDFPAGGPATRRMAAATSSRRYGLMSAARKPLASYSAMIGALA